MARQFDIALCLRRSILVEHRYTEDITTRKNMQEVLAHTWTNQMFLLDGDVPSSRWINIDNVL